MLWRWLWWWWWWWWWLLLLFVLPLYSAKWVICIPPPKWPFEWRTRQKKGEESATSELCFALWVELTKKCISGKWLKCFLVSLKWPSLRCALFPHPLLSFLQQFAWACHSESYCPSSGHHHWPFIPSACVRFSSSSALVAASDDAFSFCLWSSAAASARPHCTVHSRRQRKASAEYVSIYFDIY